MNKFSINSKILFAFLTWRIALFIIDALAIFLISHFNNSFPYVNTDLAPSGLPSWVWGFGNFDGVHYLRIARLGYAANQYTQAFFPLYPVLIKLFSVAGNYLLAGLFISNLSFLIALYFLYKLLALDYDKHLALKSLALLLVFPTAFYFGAVYSESLFLLLAILSIYFLRKKNYLLSGVMIFLSSLTRIVGVFLILVFLVELYQDFKKEGLVLKSKQLVLPASGLIIALLGIISYMIYLKVNFNNPIYFLTAQPIFGAQRSESIVLLPQVFYRYIKILFTVPIHNYDFFTAASEFIFSILGLLLLIFSVTKVRFSYWLFSACCYLLPTLTGTFSSMPRYILMEFLLLPFLAGKVGKFFVPLAILLGITEATLLSLFIRGYWIA